MKGNNIGVYVALLVVSCVTSLGHSLWTRRVIDSNSQGAECVCAPDIDNDGDHDVVASGYVSDDIRWYHMG
jgi:hypothetical protein